MLGDAKIATKVADALLAGASTSSRSSFPVVPRDGARIRVQPPAAHTSSTSIERSRPSRRSAAPRCDLARARARQEPPEAGIWLEDVPRPTIGPNDLLVRVRYTSSAYGPAHLELGRVAQKTIPVPLVIGHEFEGSVAEIGSEGTDSRRDSASRSRATLTAGTAGTAVPVAGPVPAMPSDRRSAAGRLRRVRRSAGLERVRAASGMPDEIGACLVRWGRGVHSALSFELAGEDVLITGAGPIGVMAAAVCRFVGARYVVVTDRNPYRLSLARRLGATLAVDFTATTLDAVMKELGMLEGFDVGLEMSGSPEALRSMLAFMNHGGRVALLGIPDREIPIDWNQVIFRGSPQGIYGREMFETWYRMGSSAAGGLDITAVITTVFRRRSSPSVRCRAVGSVRQGRTRLDVLSRVARRSKQRG